MNVYHITNELTFNYSNLQLLQLYRRGLRVEGYLQKE